MSRRTGNRSWRPRNGNSPQILQNAPAAVDQNLALNQRTLPVQNQLVQRAYCDRCDRSFVHDRALQQHRTHSMSHHICPFCEYDHETRSEKDNVRIVLL